MGKRGTGRSGKGSVWGVMCSGLWGADGAMATQQHSRCRAFERRNESTGAREGVQVETQERRAQR